MKKPPQNEKAFQYNESEIEISITTDFYSSRVTTNYVLKN